MNAISTVDGQPRSPMAPPHATHKFGLLLRREFWEHKGGFLWSPVWAGGISLLLTTMARHHRRSDAAKGHAMLARASTSTAATCRSMAWTWARSPRR